MQSGPGSNIWFEKEAHCDGSRLSENLKKSLILSDFHSEQQPVVTERLEKKREKKTVWTLLILLNEAVLNLGGF